MSSVSEADLHSRAKWHKNLTNIDKEERISLAAAPYTSKYTNLGSIFTNSNQ